MGRHGILRAVGRHVAPATSTANTCTANTPLPTVAVIMGFGDGVRPPIMTDAPGKQVADAYDPDICKLLGDDKVQLLNYDEAMSRPDGVDAILTVSHPPVNGDLLDRLKPKTISNYGVGVNHIDLDAATARGIPVGNTPGVLNEATADMAMALMLACSRRLGECNHYAKSGQWVGYEHMVLLGQDVSNSTVGIIGMGRIGFEVARRAKLGFGCRILYHNRSRRPDCEEQLGAEYCANLHSLLEQSDTVILVTVMSPETANIIDATALHKMKRSASLVNVSRGGTVDTAALTTALRNGEIAAAGLDVTEPEPLPTDHELYSMPNVVFSPHRGSATVRTRRLMSELCVENLLMGLAGAELPARCN